MKWGGRPRTRRIPGEMNKTELAYGGHLYLLKKAGEIEDYIFEGIRFKLAPNTTYTPDFVVVTPSHIEVHEVKGRLWEDDARVKIKVAAAMYYWIKFLGVTKDLKTRQWVYEEF